MFKIGCHLSISNGFLKTAKNIIDLGGNTFQYFSRNPQGGQARPWNQLDFENYMEYAKSVGIEVLL
ncbi:MAG: endonuclease IV, partial [Anaeroplasmataceae bacterium]|nr:endonuclease IV [Anaeroplasmataceae bacterium]